ncbi:response regulator [Calycomorphotria hydatis]|uniref:Transcriptional regulatory protein DpiA n=1 Tax=Calycomorphotria hydatis TaxID=2528027 RepID=A0A517T361_9PLAN|nr:response regulator [Calycomorphotria hydatis]QDT62817.1 Transcriptional regulatory protein DpiA [Calycomorphotria hydatis]
MSKFQRWKPLTGLSLLVVEDNPDEQRLIAHYVERSGGGVMLECNGKSAVYTMKKMMPETDQIHAVIMDLYLPEDDGISATREMRALGYDGPIIATSSRADDDNISEWITAGCDTFLDKPVARHDLIASVVRNCCDTMLREINEKNQQQEF